MLEQVGWILRGYATRPMMWVIVAAGLIASPFNFINAPRSHRRSAYPPEPVCRLKVDSKAMLERVRASGRRMEVDGLDLPALWRDLGPRKKQFIESLGKEADVIEPPTEEFFEILEEFPNVKSLTFDCDYKGTGWTFLRRCKNVESLTLTQFAAVAPLDVSEVGHAEKLQRLELQSHRLPKGIEKLPHLETLILHFRGSVNDEMLRDVSRMPALTTLVLDIWDRLVFGGNLTAKGLSNLESSETLATVYLGSRADGDQGVLLAEAQRACSRIAVRPAQIDAPVRLPFFMATAAPFVIIAAAIGFQLATQFCGAASRLAPAYATLHLAVAGVLAAVVVALAALLWTFKGGAWGPTLATACALFACGVAIPVEAAFHNSMRGEVRWTARIWSGALSILFLTLVLWPGLGESLLVDHRPIVPICLYAAAGVAVWRVGVALRGLSACDGLVGGFGGVSNKEFASKGWVHRNGGWRIFRARRERRIEQIADVGRARTPWERVQRWRLANPAIPTTAFTLIMICWMHFFSYAFAGAMSAQSSSWKMNLQLAIGMAFFGGVMQYAGAWRQRILSAPIEMLRPVPAAGFRSEWCAALALDLARVALVNAAAAAVALNYKDSFALDWSNVAVDFAVFAVAGFLLALGIAGIFIVIDRIWLALASAIGVLYLVLAVVAGLMIISGARPGRMDAHSVAPHFWAPLAVGVFLCLVAWRKWRLLEFNRTV